MSNVGEPGVEFLGNEHKFRRREKNSPPYVDVPHKLHKALWMKLFERLKAAKR